MVLGCGPWLRFISEIGDWRIILSFHGFLDTFFGGDLARYFFFFVCLVMGAVKYWWMGGGRGRDANFGAVWYRMEFVFWLGGNWSIRTWFRKFIIICTTSTLMMGPTKLLIDFFFNIAYFYWLVCKRFIVNEYCPSWRNLWRMQSLMYLRHTQTFQSFNFVNGLVKDLLPFHNLLQLRVHPYACDVTLFKGRCVRTQIYDTHISYIHNPTIAQMQRWDHSTKYNRSILTIQG